MSAEASRVYLQRVELSNFRAFGESFTLEIPDGPGITLIHGPNGLGKTTFFDGIEWCLTGRISRFERYPSSSGSRRSQYLTRLGAPEGSHRVSLAFTGVNPIDRGQGFEPEVAEITRVLKQPEWPDVSDLGRYLSITHFLGQSAAQRISVKLPKEQWEALKGPTGIERVNQIKDRIGGNATRQAFTRYIRQVEAAVVSRRRDLESWELLIERMIRLRSLSNSADGLSPSAVIDLCESTIRALGAAGLIDHVPDTAQASPESALERARNGVSVAETRLNARSSQLQSLEAIVEEVSSIQNEIRTTSELAHAAESRRVSADDEASSTRKELDRARRRQEEALQRRTAAEKRLRTTTWVVESLDTQSHARTRLDELGAELPLLIAQISRLEIVEEEWNASIHAAQQRSAQRKELVERIRRLGAAAPFVQEIESLISRLAAERAADPEEEVFARLQEQREALLLAAAKLGSIIESLEEQLDSHDRRHVAITAAVRELAASLTADDLECPVCSTQFLQGELLALVSANRKSPELGARELSDSLVSKRSELATITSQIEDLERRVHAQLAKWSVVEAMESRVRELQEQIAELSMGRSIETIGSLEALSMELTSQLQELDAVLSENPSEDDLSAQAEKIRATRTDALARSANLRVEQSDLLERWEKARSTLDQFPEIWTPENGLVLPLEELRASAADEVVAATTLLTSSNEAISALNDKLEAWNRESTEAAAAREAYLHRGEELAGRRVTLTANWQLLGMPGEPDIQAVWGERDRIGQATLLLSSAQEQVDRAHRQYRNRLTDEELIACEQEMQERMKAEGIEGEWETMSAHLHKAVLNAEQLISRAHRAKERVDVAVRDLKEMASTYAQDVLQPLNDTIQEFAYVLLTRADGSLLFRSEHHANRSELRPGILRTDASGRPELLDLNPNFFFSEGQLSALSVSALLAASTTFRWSRWPALLLDDPLQHNDVIHASAFIDLLRRLVSQLGYQVILSSHDAAEADFIARKCRSAGIRYSHCELLPPSETDIVSGTADVVL